MGLWLVNGLVNHRRHRPLPVLLDGQKVDRAHGRDQPPQRLDLAEDLLPVDALRNRPRGTLEGQAKLFFQPPAGAQRIEFLPPPPGPARRTGRAPR